MSESQVTPSTQTPTQAMSLDDSQSKVDLFSVLASLQQTSVELGTLLQQQPHLLHELGAMASGEPNPLSVLPPTNAELPINTESTLELPTSSQPLQYESSQSGLPSTSSQYNTVTESNLTPSVSSSSLLDKNLLPGQLLSGQPLPQVLEQTLPEQSTSSSGPVRPTVYKEQDRFLPIHNVARIMRNSITQSGKVSKEAKECMQECVSEFISFITSEASDRCLVEKRKTITGDDILCAMATLGFDNYIEPLRLYLQNYREYTRDKTIDPSPQSAADTLSTPQAVAQAVSVSELRPPPPNITQLPTQLPVVTVSSVLAVANNAQLSSAHMQ